MANNWQSLDANFPTFEEHESPHAQIQKLVDYMRQLTDQLRYSLNNLGTDNWNSSNLKEFSASLTGDIEKDMKTCLAAVQNLQDAVRGLDTKVTSQGAQLEKLAQLEKAVTKLTKTVEDQATTIKEQGEALEKLQQAQTTAGDNIRNLQDAVSALCQHTQADGDTLTVGYAGSTLKLRGDVYINDVLQEA